MLKENLKLKTEDIKKAVWLPEEVHYALKNLSAKENLPIHNLIAILINNYQIYKNEIHPLK